MSVEFDDILKAIAVIKMKSKNLQKKFMELGPYIDLYIILYLNPRNSFQQNRIILNTASHKKGTTLKVANSEFQFFCYFVMGPYE